jgi:alkenylglycerophosphocholine/alkenylglycerophosphoethanolamine hydrolase
LVLGLAGDVFLMLPDRHLLPGIAAFLAGHLAYAAGFRFAGFNGVGLLVGLLIVAATAALFLRRVLTAVETSGRANLRNPVLAYAVVISLMTVSATASGNLVAAAGGLLFFFSDVIFAWYRFVKPVRWGQPVNIVMYQAGQALLVLSLALGS